MAVPANPDFRHDTPDELRAMLDADHHLLQKWDALTELARNEWICWTISAGAMPVVVEPVVVRSVARRSASRRSLTSPVTAMFLSDW